MSGYFDELELLGLKPSEKKVILAIQKIAKSIAQIVRFTQLPRSSVVYTLKKLEEKSFVLCIKEGKKKFWRSNIPKTLLKLKNTYDFKEARK